MTEFLSQVSPDLQALGVEKDTLYYVNDDVKITSIESNNRVGKFKRSLNALQLGGIAEVIVPCWDFLGSCYLQATITAPLGVTLTDYWLCNAIRQISYTWGQSNNSILKIDRYDIIHHNILSCETKSKRNKMQLLGGEPKSITELETTHTAQILLKFPWSVMSACDAKKLYDTRLLNDPITLSIEFEPAIKFMGCTDALLPSLPTAFNKAELIVKQQELSNHSDSLAGQMKKNPNLLYSYPFVHLQTGTTALFEPTVDTDFTFRKQLFGFLTTDLLGIMFSVVYEHDDRRLNRPNEVTAYPNPLAMRRVENVLLQYNGQTLHDLPGKMLELSTLNICQDDPDVSYSHFDNDTGIITAKEAFVYYLPFTQNKDISFKEEYSNCSTYSSQPLDLQFTINTPDEGNYILHTTYLYNASTSTQAGVTRVHLG